MFFLSIVKTRSLFSILGKIRIRKQARPIHRSDYVKEYPEPFHGMGRESVEKARQLEAALRSAATPEALEANWVELNQTCLQCHQHYRNQ